MIHSPETASMFRLRFSFRSAAMNAGLPPCPMFCHIWYKTWPMIGQSRSEAGEGGEFWDRQAQGRKLALQIPHFPQVS